MNDQNSNYYSIGASKDTPGPGAYTLPSSLEGPAHVFGTGP